MSRLSIATLCSTWGNWSSGFPETRFVGESGSTRSGCSSSSASSSFTSMSYSKSAISGSSST